MSRAFRVVVVVMGNLHILMILMFIMPSRWVSKKIEACLDEVRAHIKGKSGVDATQMQAIEFLYVFWKRKEKISEENKA